MYALHYQLNVILTVDFIRELSVILSTIRELKRGGFFVIFIYSQCIPKKQWSRDVVSCFKMQFSTIMTPFRASISKTNEGPYFLYRYFKRADFVHTNYIPCVNHVLTVR